LNRERTNNEKEEEKTSRRKYDCKEKDDNR